MSGHSFPAERAPDDAWIGRAGLLDGSSTVHLSPRDVIGWLKDQRMEGNPTSLTVWGPSTKVPGGRFRDKYQFRFASWEDWEIYLRVVEDAIDS